MTLYYNECEGTDGVTVDATNSAASPNRDGFSSVGGTSVYDTDVPGAVREGSSAIYCYGAGVNSSVTWQGSFGKSLAFVGYFYWSTLPGSDHRFVQFKNNSSSTVFAMLVSSAGRWQYYNAITAVTTNLSPSDSDVSSSTLYRVEIWLRPGTTTSNGEVDVEIYAGESLTPLRSLSLTGQNYGTADLETVTIGKPLSSGTVGVHIDSVAIETDASAFLGVISDVPSQSYDVSEWYQIDITGSTGTTTLTQTSGTTVLDIVGPTDDIIWVQLPVHYTDALVFDLETTGFGDPITTEIRIMPKGRRFVLSKISGSWDF